MNPWVIIGFIVALGGAWWAGDHHGAAEKQKEWTISAQQTKLDYDKKLKDAQDAKEASEHAYSDLKDKTDAQHAEDQDKISAGAKRADDAIAHGLRRAERCNVGSVGSVSGNSQPVSGNGEGATPEFYLLPGQSPGRLRDRYAEADNFLSLYRACRIRLQDAITKSRAPR